MGSDKFGFIGLGNMGLPIAGRLIDAGHSLVVHDVNESALAPLVARGAQAAASPAEVAAAAGTVFISLPTPPIVETVATGDAGLASGGAVRRIVDLSTTGPQMAATLCAKLADRDIRWLDCPVSGGVGGARAGTLAVMFSGPREDFDDLLPVLQVIGKPFYISDRPGLAQTMKLLNNQLSAAAMALTCEAAVMGTKAGIDPTVMIDVVNAGSGRNTASMQKFPQSILPRTFDYGFSTGLMHKDSALFMQEAKAMGLSLPACEVVLGVWQRALDELGADSDFTRLITLMEKDAGVEVRGGGTATG
ncbi:NAD(P)-dependent oxidoreductase [Microbaculum marinum]|uniref:NAD(P)-dependent oxidoreductase n=1 Tax=Microbaculum marinum TaxID=1764581 RepID=A0AAW9RRN8_9HYPH